MSPGRDSFAAGLRGPDYLNMAGWVFLETHPSLTLYERTVQLGNITVRLMDHLDTDKDRKTALFTEIQGTARKLDELMDQVENFESIEGAFTYARGYMKDLFNVQYRLWSITQDAGLLKNTMMQNFAVPGSLEPSP